MSYLLLVKRKTADDLFADLKYFPMCGKYAKLNTRAHEVKLANNGAC